MSDDTPHGDCPCNDCTCGRIDALESRVEQLEADNDAMESVVEDLDGRVEALNRARMHILEEQDEKDEVLDRVLDRLAEVEELIAPDPGSTQYQQLTKAQKVHRLRKTLVQTAAQTNGRDAMKYKAVMALFDGHPSPGHCYDLMERAAELDGFAYDEAGGGKGEKRVRVKLDGVNDETLIHAANKATSAGGV